MSYGNLSKLSEVHQQVAALMAQGVRRADIAAVVKLTPEYLNSLTHDPLFKAYMDEMVEFSQRQIEAMFCGTVNAIGDGLMSEDSDTALKAARLQLEVTNRIGRGERTSPTTEDSINRLAKLAERLANLNTTRHTGEFLEGEIIQSNQLPAQPQNRHLSIAQSGQD